LALVVAVAVSFFPTAVMNRIHAGDWLGASTEPKQLVIHRPLDGVLGNGLELLQANLVPPVFPLAQAWDRHVQSVIPSNWLNEFQSGFFVTGELPSEDWAGVGMGISLLALAFMFASLGQGRFRKQNNGGRQVIPKSLLRWVLIAPWISLLVYCVKAGMSTPARLVAAYYPLMLPLLLTRANSTQFVRRAWWQALAAVVVFLAFAVLVLSADRPLWPARTVLTRLAVQHPGSHLLARARNVYTVYSDRHDALADVRKLLPPEVRAVGFIGTADDIDISLWLPYGTRRVEHFFVTDPPEQIRSKVEYVVVGGYNLRYYNLTIDAWLQQTGAELVGTANATMKVGEGMQPWYVVRFKR